MPHVGEVFGKVGAVNAESYHKVAHSRGYFNLCQLIIMLSDG